MKRVIFEAWNLQLNNQFKSQNQKMITILDSASSHVVSSAKVGKSHGFPTLELRNMTLVFLLFNVTNVVQPLDQGIIASFKIQCKKKFLQWVKLQYIDATLKDLRKVVPNIKHVIMWSYEVWSKLDAHIVKNCWRMARTIHATWNVDFSLVDVMEKNQMNLVFWFQSYNWVMMRCQSRLRFKWKGKRFLS